MALNAKELGRKLLDEVEELSLSEVLNSARRQDGVPLPSFNIPALDALVKAHQPARAKDRPPVVELNSAISGGGKSHLIYIAIAAAVLPGSKPSTIVSNERTSKGHGKAGIAIVFDTKGTFDVERLMQIMVRYEGGPVSKQTENDAPAFSNSMAVVEHALRHVHVFKPQSLDSLVVTVQTLPEYLFDLDRHFSSERALELIAIDSVTSFFWQEKSAQDAGHALDDGAEHSSPTKGNIGSTGSSGYVSLVRALRSVQQQFFCPIISSSWGLFTALPTDHQQIHSETMPRPRFKPMLPPAWQDLCTLRLGVGRQSIKRFPAGMTLEQSESDRESRWSAVQRGKWAAWVDPGVNGDERLTGSGFSFRVTTDGVLID